MSFHFVFYGPEGCGKGTQAELLGEKYNFPVLISGDLVRDAAANDKGMMGEIVKEALNSGKYVADSEMFVLWKRRFKQDDVKNGWILDGFPRNIDQAMFLEDKVEKYGQPITVVFHLKVSIEESMKRLASRNREAYKGAGKSHDSPEMIKSRLEMYYQGEPAVLDFYRKRGILTTINGEQSIEKVHEDIMKVVEGLKNQN
jgi:adenylate kinase